jgi:transposase
MGYIQGEDRNQIVLLAECIDDYVGEENPVRVIDAFVASINLDELGFAKAKPADTGRPPYNPADLLKLSIYGYSNAVRSSRKLERETHKNLEVIWLLNKLKPDFKTISDFRKDNKEALKKVFKMFTLLCKKWALFGKDLVAVDGSKFRASNSKKNNFSKKKLNRSIKYIEEQIDQYLKELEDTDNHEKDDARLTLEEMKKRIEELRSRKAVYEELKVKMDEENINEISKTDPDSRQMKVNNNGMDVCYNVQTAVDSKNNLVVDFDVTSNASDQNELGKMSLKAKEDLGVESLEVLADKGYYNADDLKKCEQENITTFVAKQSNSNGTGVREYYPDKFKYNEQNDTYICPNNQELKYKRTKGERRVYSNFDACSSCQFKELCTKSKKGREISRAKDQDFLDIVDTRTALNKEKYRKRQSIIEHVFGTIKRAMNAGYFLTRKIDSVGAETSLTFLAYNMKRVINILGVKEIIRRLATE